jgi:hypothetical protein
LTLLDGAFDVRFTARWQRFYYRILPDGHAAAEKEMKALLRLDAATCVSPRYGHEERFVGVTGMRCSAVWRPLVLS